ncbi:uncharacterized protein LOC123671529 [Harmonia axyridis]|uniref:uncharacterized protein LOC123671529 n=1 Tax=Harmonia axyridis TaxID=115357 RepID=UPI001E2791EE|nr:uncharacterized protein LOC123671529 [Harmonia axyridis]
MKHRSNICLIIVFCNLISYSQSWKPPIIWEEGINWVQMVVGIGIPVDLKDATITIGSAAKAYYLLPTNTSNTDYTTYERTQGRSLLRQRIYSTVEDILQRYGFGDGKSCLLKLICDYSKKETGKNTLISKVVDIILRPSSTTDETKENIYFSAENMGAANMDCSYLFPECEHDIINTFLKEYIFPE